MCWERGVMWWYEPGYLPLYWLIRKHPSLYIQTFWGERCLIGMFLRCLSIPTSGGGWMLRIKNIMVYTLPETNSSHLKMDGWNTSFLLGPGLCSGEKLLVSRRVIISINLGSTVLYTNYSKQKSSGHCSYGSSRTMISKNWKSGLVDLHQHTRNVWLFWTDFLAVLDE